MAHYYVSAARYRDRMYDDDRWPPRAEPGKSLSAYRFGQLAGEPADGRLSRVSRYFRQLIGSIASSKLRRMERELELRGIGTRDHR